MKKSIIAVLAILMIVLVAMPGFSQAKLKVLFMPGVADPFYFTMEKGIRAAADKAGVDLTVAEYPKAWGPENQIPILQATIASGKFDLLLIAPTSNEALKAPLKAIYNSGTEIITVDTFLGDGDYSKPSDYNFPLSYIGSDNELGGKQMAEHLANLVGKKGKVYVQATNPDASSVQGRVKGFQAGVAEFPNMKLVGVEWCLDVQQKAQEQTLAALQKDKDIVGIFGLNVFSAQGATQADINAGLSGAVKMCLWDATLDNIANLKKGNADLVLAQKPGEMGALGIEWGVKYLKDKKNVKVPKKVIPGFEFFTRENVNSPAMQPFIYQ
ncbi:MAG TPA: ABC transporter substrate-binding protein [Rectinemataceae bacterium]|nr:ABC transporter substrate-binding protein [Rectinemataceae bacterium]